VATIGRRRTGGNGGQMAAADSVRQGGKPSQTLWVGTNEEVKRKRPAFKRSSLIISSFQRQPVIENGWRS